jgi:formyltetrahydrofolate-dependent phosphoribosylglycinamide formyltransferase
MNQFFAAHLHGAQKKIFKFLSTTIDMFSGLKKRWNVDGWRLLLILITFAVAGSATGYVGKLLMSFLQIETPWLYIIIYIVAVTVIWPFMVIVVSFFFGQFNFFSGYLKRIAARLIGVRKTISDSNSSPAYSSKTSNVAVFASGTGTNAQKIIDHFRHHAYIKIGLLATNKSTAGVLEIAKKEGIPALIIDKEKFFRGNAYVDELRKYGIDFIVLAGFLWKLPPPLVNAWQKRIVNIHPALLPKYGGKGLYGRHVHEAVIRAGEKESGITIHYVDEIYDHGDSIFQERVIVEKGDTPEILSKKIQALEHLHFPRIIEQVIQDSRK